MTRLNPFKRPGETPQQTGRRFEEFWADILGVEPTKGSGNQWTAKLDVGDGTILWELRHTERESFSVTKQLMRQIEAAINAPGGVGGDAIPGLATSLGGEVFVTFRASDFLRLFAMEGARYIVPSKGEQKRRAAKVPLLLREDE